MLLIVVAGIALLGLLGAILAVPVIAWMWRSVEYAFRRTTGMPPGIEMALGARPTDDDVPAEAAA